MKKILKITFSIILSLICLSFSYADDDLKYKVLGLEKKQSIICINTKTKKNNIWGFSYINDEIVGEFKLVHQIRDGKWSPVEAIVFRDEPGWMSWNDFAMDSIGWYAFPEEKLSQEKPFKMISEIYFFDTRDDDFKNDILQRMSKLDDSLYEKKISEIDDIDARAYLIGVLAITKKFREQETIMINDKTYARYEEDYACKVGK